MSKTKIKNISKKCPKCGDLNSLDYKPDLKIWKCIWSSCNYEEKEVRIFTKEEMGYVAYEGVIMLSDKFVDDHLHLLNYLWRRYDTPVELDVQCPFCKEGVLVIKEMKKNICEIHVCHTGDSFTVRCSNDKTCGGYFAYHHTFY